MRVAITFLGLDLLTIEATTTDDVSAEMSPDLGSDVVYAEPTGHLGFVAPAGEYGYGDE